MTDAIIQTVNSALSLRIPRRVSKIVREMVELLFGKEFCKTSGDFQKRRLFLVGENELGNVKKALEGEIKKNYYRYGTKRPNVLVHNIKVNLTQEESSFDKVLWRTFEQTSPLDANVFLLTLEGSGTKEELLKLQHFLKFAGSDNKRISFMKKVVLLTTNPQIFNAFNELENPFATAHDMTRKSRFWFF